MNSSLQTPMLPTSRYDTSSPFLNQIPTEEIIIDDDGWLYKEFSRLPFQLYRIWLASTLLFVIFANFQSITFLWSELKNVYSLFLRPIEFYEPSTVAISCIFLTFGCYEMFSAIERQKSEMAQTGILKFQYSLGLLLISSINYMVWFKFDFTYYSTTALLITFALPVIPAVNLVGGMAVLRAFQMNHPLVKRSRNLEETNPHVSLLLEQNTVIAGELVRFDLQLERWPYLVYKWWLKFAVALKIYMTPSGMVFKLARIWRNKDMTSLLVFLLPVLAHIMGAYCSYDMEVVLGTRKLKRSERALLQLKICIVISAIFSIAVPLLETRKDDSVGKYLEALWYNVLGFILIPVITFVGALGTKKVIEERDGFATVSNFQGGDFEMPRI